MGHGIGHVNEDRKTWLWLVDRTVMVSHGLDKRSREAPLFQQRGTDLGVVHTEDLPLCVTSAVAFLLDQVSDTGTRFWDEETVEKELANVVQEARGIDGRDVFLKAWQRAGQRLRATVVITP